VLFAPVIHRFLHRFHLELAADQDAPRKDLPGRQSYRADRSRRGELPQEPRGEPRPPAGSDSAEP
jgi:hypothetical protein